MARMHRSSLALVLLCVLPMAGIAATSSFAHRLLEADKIRSSDPQRFAILLEELDATKQGAEPALVQQLQYLKAYQNVVYRNQVGEGIDQAKVLFKGAVEQDLRFRAGLFLTNSLAMTRNFSEGLRILNQTLPMRDQVKSRELRHDGLNVAAVFYNQLGQYKLGLQYADEVLAGAPTEDARCIAGISRLDAQYQLGVLPDDDSLIHHDIERCLVIGNRMAANFKRLVLARKWVGQGDLDKAVELLEKSMVEVKAVGYHRLKAEFHALLSELKLKKGELESAKAHAQAAIAEVDPQESTRPLADANKVLYQIAERNGELAAALAFFQRYAQADKADLNDIKVRELAYEIVRHEVLQNSQKIQLLSQQNEVLQLQQRVQKQANQNMGLVVVLLALLVAGVGYWAYKVKRLHLTLRHFAETDALTGVSNRHHFTQQGQRSLAQCETAGESAALIMFDLDHFKAINDTYGHDAGDWVLRHVATTSAGLCRRIDQFGRVGGEEFAILLHGCELNAAVRLADDCRVRLSQIDTRDSGHTFPVTASFGVSATALSGYSLSSLMSHADLMLYRAKREGRNRVRGYRGDMPLASPRAVPPTETEGVPPASVEVPPMAVADVFEPAQGPVSERLLERRSS